MSLYAVLHGSSFTVVYLTGPCENVNLTLPQAGEDDETKKVTGFTKGYPISSALQVSWVFHEAGHIPDEAGQAVLQKCQAVLWPICCVLRFWGSVGLKCNSVKKAFVH